MMLAAGASSRLLEAQRYGSKLLIPVQRKTILERNLVFLKRAGIQDVVINLCRGKEKILKFLERNRMFGLSITFSFEKTPLGTAGGVKKAEKFLRGKDFLVLYGDNLSDFDISMLMIFHQKKQALGTIGVFCPENTKHSGILAGSVKVNSWGKVNGFIEERNNRKIAKNSYVNAGVTVFSPKIFRWIPSRRPFDFAKDLYPRLLKKKARLFAVEGASYVLASDTPEALKRTRRLAAKLL